jgi:hypothetical protein
MYFATWSRWNSTATAWTVNRVSCRRSYGASDSTLPTPLSACTVGRCATLYATPTPEDCPFDATEIGTRGCPYSCKPTEHHSRRPQIYVQQRAACALRPLWVSPSQRETTTDYVGTATRRPLICLSISEDVHR